MVEKRCYQRLDEPVLVWLGLEFKEIAFSLGMGAGTALLGGFLLGLGFLGVLAGFATGAGFLFLFRGLRTGGPGCVFAKSYRLGLAELLPRALRPRHLLPLPGGGRRGAFQLSPCLGEDPPMGAPDARAYFGR